MATDVHMSRVGAATSRGTNCGSLLNCLPNPLATPASNSDGPNFDLATLGDRPIVIGTISYEAMRAGDGYYSVAASLSPIGPSRKYYIVATKSTTSGAHRDNGTVRATWQMYRIIESSVPNRAVPIYSVLPASAHGSIVLCDIPHTPSNEPSFRRCEDKKPGLLLEPLYKTTLMVTALKFGTCEYRPNLGLPAASIHRAECTPFVMDSIMRATRAPTGTPPATVAQHNGLRQSLALTLSDPGADPFWYPCGYGCCIASTVM